MKKYQLFLIATLILSTGLYGCGGGDDSTSAPAPTPAPAQETSTSAPATPTPPAMPANVALPGGISAEMQEKMIEAAAAHAGVDADIELDGVNSGTFKVNDAEHGEMSTSFGESAALPDDLPEDLPVYDGMVPSVVNKAAEGNVVNIIATSSDTFEKISSFYKEQTAAQGWNLSSENEMPGVTHALMYEKDNRMLRVVLTPAPTGGTQIMMSSGEK